MRMIKVEPASPGSFRHLPPGNSTGAGASRSLCSGGHDLQCIPEEEVHRFSVREAPFEGKRGIGARDPPAPPGPLHPQIDNLPTGALDDTGHNLRAVLAKPVILQLRLRLFGGEMVDAPRRGFMPVAMWRELDNGCIDPSGVQFLPWPPPFASLRSAFSGQNIPGPNNEPSGRAAIGLATRALLRLAGLRVNTLGRVNFRYLVFADPRTAVRLLSQAPSTSQFHTGTPGPSTTGPRTGAAPVAYRYPAEATPQP